MERNNFKKRKNISGRRQNPIFISFAILITEKRLNSIIINKISIFIKKLNSSF